MPVMMAGSSDSGSAPLMMTRSAGGSWRAQPEVRTTKQQKRNIAKPAGDAANRWHCWLAERDDNFRLVAAARSENSSPVIFAAQARALAAGRDGGRGVAGGATAGMRQRVAAARAGVGGKRQAWQERVRLPLLERDSKFRGSIGRELVCRMPAGHQRRRKIDRAVFRDLGQRVARARAEQRVRRRRRQRPCPRRLPSSAVESAPAESTAAQSSTSNDGQKSN